MGDVTPRAQQSGQPNRASPMDLVDRVDQVDHGGRTPAPPRRGRDEPRHSPPEPPLAPPPPASAPAPAPNTRFHVKRAANGVRLGVAPARAPRPGEPHGSNRRSCGSLEKRRIATTGMSQASGESGGRLQDLHVAAQSPACVRCAAAMRSRLARERHTGGLSESGSSGRVKRVWRRRVCGEVPRTRSACHCPLRSHTFYGPAVVLMGRATEYPVRQTARRSDSGLPEVPS